MTSTRCGQEAKKTALIVSAKIKHLCRNFSHAQNAIDGSNTSGFQRTMLVSQGRT